MLIKIEPIEVTRPGFFSLIECNTMDVINRSTVFGLYLAYWLNCIHHGGMLQQQHGTFDVHALRSEHSELKN